MAGDRKKLFHLREYDEAFLKVFSRVIHLRAEEAYPLLKEIPTEPPPAIHTSQVTLPSGEALTNELFEMKVAFRFNLSDMVSGNIDAFTASSAHRRAAGTRNSGGFHPSAASAVSTQATP